MAGKEDINDLNQLKHSIGIVQLAEVLGLQVRGSQARCFNAEGHKYGDKNPSLGLDTKTNRFKCFACGVSGSIIDLYMQVKGINSFQQAISELNALTGLEKLPQMAGDGYKKTAQTKETGKITPIRGIYEALKGFCGGLDKESLDYLTGGSRGLTKETIARFNIFSIKDYAQVNGLMKDKYSLEQLKEAGLVSKQGNLIFYRHKIITPFIKDGEIIFLQGRRTDNQHPRYMHLKRSVPLFNTETLKTLKAGERVYICEGVFDAIMLEQQDYRAVAILGVNNFKPEMAGPFKGLDVMLCLDNDESGRQATKALARAFLPKGQGVRQKILPEGIKDITEFFLKCNTK